VGASDDQCASASRCDVAEEREHLEAEERLRAGVVAEVDVPQAVRDHPGLGHVRERHYHLPPGARTHPLARTDQLIKRCCEDLTADRVEGAIPFGVL
jgi:hypothetical protein